MTCLCMGPQGGQPLCHCLMAAANQYQKSWYQFQPYGMADLLKKDAERLDWLERENPIVFHKTSSVDEWTLIVGVSHDNDGTEYSGKTLREAIDAAMKP